MAGDKSEFSKHSDRRFSGESGKNEIVVSSIERDIDAMEKILDALKNDPDSFLQNADFAFDPLKQHGEDLCVNLMLLGEMDIPDNARGALASKLNHLAESFGEREEGLVQDVEALKKKFLKEEKGIEPPSIDSYLSSRIEKALCEDLGLTISDEALVEMTTKIMEEQTQQEIDYLIYRTNNDFLDEHSRIPLMKTLSWRESIALGYLGNIGSALIGHGKFLLESIDEDDQDLELGSELEPESP